MAQPKSVFRAQEAQLLLSAKEAYAKTLGTSADEIEAIVRPATNVAFRGLTENWNRGRAASLENRRAHAIRLRRAHESGARARTRESRTQRCMLLLRARRRLHAELLAQLDRLWPAWEKFARERSGEKDEM